MEGSNIDTGKAIGYGWASVKKDFWYFVGIALVVIIISSLGQDRDGPSQWSLLSFLLSGWMACGYWTLFLSYHSGKKLPFSALFTQFTHYVRFLLASLLLGIIFAVGFVLLIIPGFYFALKYQFTLLLILDKNLGISDAMKQSALLTSGKKMSLLGFDIVSLGVVILGAIVLGVGILVAVPVVWLANVFVYRSLSVSLPTPQAAPAAK